MSRIGKQPISVPEKVKVNLKDQQIFVEGPLGKLEKRIDPLVEVFLEQGKILVKPRDVSTEARARHGMMRNLICNMVAGVTEGFKRELEIKGVGYKAEVKGAILNLSLGFSHPVEFPIPTGIKIHVEKQVNLQVSGSSRELVGETAARIRKIRPPEPYKGKGIKYQDEIIRRKVGKAAVGSGGGK